MKEITRRLYTKPVMLGMAFLVGMALVVGLFVTSKSKASTSIFIQAGDDAFETTGNGETYHNFQASPVPAGFFGTGSQQYAGLVPLVGVPLNPQVNDNDTVIHRNQNVFTPGTTTITMTALNLKSINPITVSYNDGHTEDWTVKVNLSTLQTSGGSMSFNADGSAFDSSLSVYPKFTFTRVSDGTQKVLDTGGGGSGLASVSDGSSGGDSLQAVIAPAPEPTLAPAPCRAIAISDFESQTTVSAASTSCAPVTLTSTNSPWPITRPITEQELLASHNASPPGTKKAIAARAVAIGE
jgi:hypothetical protein